MITKRNVDGCQRSDNLCDSTGTADMCAQSGCPGKPGEQHRRIVTLTAYRGPANSASVPSPRTGSPRRHGRSAPRAEQGSGAAPLSTPGPSCHPGHPGRGVILPHKRELLDRWTELIADLGVADPAAVARECFLLLEGAYVQIGLGMGGPVRCRGARDQGPPHHRRHALLKAASKAAAGASNARSRTKRNASGAPRSRSMPASSHSMEIGPW